MDTESGTGKRVGIVLLLIVAVAIVGGIFLFPKREIKPNKPDSPTDVVQPTTPPIGNLPTAYTKALALVVEIAVQDNKFLPIIKERIKAKFPADDSPVKLYFRDEVSQLNMTPEKRLVVNVNIDSGNYKDSKGLAFLAPNKARFTFTMSGDESIKTSWDHITPFTVSAPAVEGVNERQYKELRLEFIDQLKKAILAKTGTIPSFELFPGVSADTAKIVNDAGEIDNESIRALSILSPEALNQQLAALISKDLSQSVKLDLCVVMVERNLTNHLNWVLKTVQTAEPENLVYLINAVLKTPDFGDYAVLTELMKKDSSTRLIETFTAIAKTNPRMLKSFETLCLDKANPNREVHIGAFMSILSSDQKNDYSAWILDSDSTFAVAALKAICDSAETCNKLIQDNYSKVANPVKSAMWQNVLRHAVYQKISDIQVLLELNVKEAATNNDQMVAASARGALLSSMRSNTTVWKKVIDLRSIFPPEEQQRLIKEVVSGAPQAEPELAFSGLSELLKDEQKSVEKLLKETPEEYKRKIYGNHRSQILAQMVKIWLKNGITDADYDRLTALLKAAPENDTALEVDILRALDNNSQHKNMDFTNQKLKTIIQNGMKNPFIPGRNAANALANRGMKAGTDPFYKSALEAALKTEEDVNIKKSLNRYLGNQITPPQQ